jgi:hypothetical protein
MADNTIPENSAALRLQQQQQELQHQREEAGLAAKDEDVDNFDASVGPTRRKSKSIFRPVSTAR